MENIENEKQLEQLAASLLKVRNKDEAKRYLKDFYSSKELEVMVSRFQIAKMLYEGISYVEIERKTGASSATIARVSESLKYGNDGMRLVLERMSRRRGR